MAGQGGFRDDPSAPDRADQVVPADHALAVFRQVDQQVENLGGGGNDLGSAGKLPPLQVQHAVVKHQ
ncbi:hypothetical protein D3C85_1424160 [compost metagenome]